MEHNWEFEAPKFWDLSESIPQQRPSDTWFCYKNISKPSFGTSKKRRTLKVSKYGSTLPPSQTTLQLSKETVFERLSRESTISFSRKSVHPITPQKRKLELEEEDDELITHTSKETVEERITRLEATYVDKGRPFGLSKKTNKIKQSIQHAIPKRVQPQSLYDEMQRVTPIVLSPIRETVPVTPHLSPSGSHHRKQLYSTHSPPPSPVNRKERMLAPHIPRQTASPIRKPTPNRHTMSPNRMQDLLTKFFNGLIQKAKERESKQKEFKENRAKAFFDHLLRKNSGTAYRMRDSMTSRKRVSTVESVEEEEYSDHLAKKAKEQMA